MISTWTALRRSISRHMTGWVPIAVALVALLGLISGVSAVIYHDTHAAQKQVARNWLLSQARLIAEDVADHPESAVANIQNIALNNETRVIVVDRSGGVIATSARAPGEPPAPRWDAAPVALLSAAYGTLEAKRPAQGRVLIAYSAVSGRDWFVVLEQPDEVAFAPLVQTERTLLSLMLLLYLLLSAAVFAAARVYRRNLGLLRQVQRYSADLQVQVARAQAAERAKSTFMVSIGHEFRTPLTNIIAYTDLLARGKPEKRELYLNVLKEETRHLQSLVLTVLDVTALEGSEVKLKFTPTDLNTLISDLAGGRMQRAAQQKLTLDVELAPALPRIAADPPWLARAIQVLLDNAITYTPAGGRIAVCTALLAGGLSVSVSDTGPGIPAEEQEHIFERFYRGAAQAPGHIRGIGLGLAICRDIVAQHAGQVSLTSQVGAGSCFTIWLPTGAEARPAPPSPTPIRLPARGQLIAQPSM